jgi:hypothetical protein
MSWDLPQFAAMDFHHHNGHWNIAADLASLDKRTAETGNARTPNAIACSSNCASQMVEQHGLTSEMYTVDVGFKGSDG